MFRSEKVPRKATLRKSFEVFPTMVATGRGLCKKKRKEPLSSFQNRVRRVGKQESISTLFARPLPIEQTGVHLGDQRDRRDVFKFRSSQLVLYTLPNDAGGSIVFEADKRTSSCKQTTLGSAQCVSSLQKKKTGRRLILN